MCAWTAGGCWLHPWADGCNSAFVLIGILEHVQPCHHKTVGQSLRARSRSRRILQKFAEVSELKCRRGTSDVCMGFPKLCVEPVRGVLTADCAADVPYVDRVLMVLCEEAVVSVVPVPTGC
mmetsp:Transcript_82630/g.145776  ORF Transcript_82630/g.145776 Transcript_82630/m.145776 type:complete len:121 (-) Transcript_82630:920-1282(-)